MRSMRFPHIEIAVADGAPMSTILERIDTAFRQYGIPYPDRKAFADGLPSRGYAMQIDFIRDWFETD